jgi:hypothetical protein
MSTKTEKQRVIQQKRYLRYDFTTEEITQKGRDLAQVTREVTALEDDAKRVAGDFKAKILAKEAERGVVCGAITSGYEMRNIPCTITLNKPKNAKKTVVRDDNGTVVCVEDMTQDEMQETLDLDSAKKKSVLGTPVITDEQAEEMSKQLSKDGNDVTVKVVRNE